MFDLNDDLRTRVIKNKTGDSLVSDNNQASIVASKQSPLDSHENQELHARLIGYYRQELDRQAENRFQQAVDEDYYDNIQWSEEDAEVLRKRGQAPLVYNVLSTSVRWVLGTEKQARSDFKVLPRRKEESDAAEKKTSLLKYLSDVNRSPFDRSRAFKDAAIVGMGWLEAGIQDESNANEMIYGRYESWRNMLWDSSATETDLSDARYVFRVKWVDVDAAIALIPSRKAQIEAAATESGRFFNAVGLDIDGDPAMDSPEQSLDDITVTRAVTGHRRKRVRLIEAWFRMPNQEKRITKGPWKGQIYDENDTRHVEYVESLAERMTYVMHCCVMTTDDILYLGKSPYRHNSFPFIPVWGYRRGRDNLPYGMVRGLRDIQDDINKRAAKAQYILATNKIIADEDAFEDIELARQEAARPDGIVLKKKNSQVNLNAERDLADAHMNLMSQGIRMIQQVGGVTDELLARSTNATSGIAIQRRQEQGSLAVAEFFDNLRFADQLQGEIWLSLIEQFMTEEKQFRITNMRGSADFISINTGLPEDDITRTKADFVVSEVDYRASVRQAQTDQLVDLLSKLAPYNPQLATVMLDLVVEGMDIHNRDELVKRIRKLTGMADPDATEPTPEEQQSQQAAAAQQQMQEQLAKANLMKIQAEADLKAAQAMAQRVAAQKQAIEGSTIAMTSPPSTAEVADHILKQAGQEPVPA